MTQDHSLIPAYSKELSTQTLISVVFIIMIIRIIKIIIIIIMETFYLYSI